MEQALKDAAEAGDDEAAIIERVGTSYREWKLQRIERQARHHLAAAYNAAVFAAAPPGSQLRWIVDDDGDACPDCDDDALAGVVTAGEPFPTGQLYPPAHDGCRCLLVRLSS
jgi:hypothetical protein